MIRKLFSLVQSPQRLSPLRHWLVTRFGTNADFKVLSVLLSAAIILLIGRSLRDERTFLVTVEQTQLPTGVLVKETSPKSVSVTLRGKKTVLDQVSPSRLRFPVNLSAAGGKESLVFPISASQVLGIPVGLSVRSFSTEAVTVTFDKNIRKFEVPKEILAEPILNGTGSLQGWVEEVVFETDKLTFYGPENRITDFLARGVRLNVSPIDLAGHIESFRTNLAIDIPESSGITAILPNPVPAFVKIVIEKNKEADRIVEETKLIEEDDPALEPTPVPGEPSSEPTVTPDPADAPSSEAPLEESPAPEAPIPEETAEQKGPADAE